MGLRDEIFEQPAAAARLLADPGQQIARVARSVAARRVRAVFLAARGSSDNAGLYAKYLWGACNRLRPGPGPRRSSASRRARPRRCASRRPTRPCRWSEATRLRCCNRDTRRTARGCR